MLKTIIIPGKKNSETIAEEKSYAERMKNKLPLRDRDSWKQVPGSGHQIAQYVFFSEREIKFGHEDGKSISFSTREIKCCFNLLEIRLKKFAGSISKKTSCDEFSNLAENMFKIFNRESSGLAFQSPIQMDRLKEMIEAVTKFILGVELDPLIKQTPYLIYKSGCGANRSLVWKPDLNGQCIGLLVELEPVYLDTLSFENLFIVNRHIIYIPSENANRFRSYSFCSHRYDAGEEGIGSPDDVLKLARLLFNENNPSQQHEAWGYIFKIMKLWYASRIRGFAPFIPQDKIDDVLIIITKMRSRQSNVTKNTNNGFFIAINEDSLEEFVYDWVIQSSDLVLRSYHYFDHRNDGDLSEMSTPTNSTRSFSSSTSSLQCVMNSLLKKTDDILICLQL